MYWDDAESLVCVCVCDSHKEIRRRVLNTSYYNILLYRAVAQLIRYSYTKIHYTHRDQIN